MDSSPSAPVPPSSSSGGASALDPSKSPSGSNSLTSPNSNPLPSSTLSNPPSPPLRRIVSSASELPNKEIKTAVFSQHVASEHYVEHQRKAMDAIREAHRHERAAWNIERQELHAKVAELEAKIKRLQAVALEGVSDSRVHNNNVGGKQVHRSASTPGDYASAGTSRQASFSGGGGSGGGIGGFLSLSGTDGLDRSKIPMQAIPEDREMERSKSVSFAAGRFPDADINKALEGYAIPGHLIDKDLDGIAIKATSLPSATKKAILDDSKSGTPSPGVSPSPRQESPSPRLRRPVTIEIPSTQQILQLPAQALYTHAAGSTPLARMADPEEENGDTGNATPKAGTLVTAEKERPPLEPYPSTFDGKPVRPPNERSDSYFNVDTSSSENKKEESKEAGAGGDPSLDEDPPLKGPLMLPTHPAPPRNQHSTQGESNEFIDQLQSKLTNISRQQSHQGATSPPVKEGSQAGTDVPADPPLRIRRSINFGSQFGHDPR